MALKCVILALLACGFVCQQHITTQVVLVCPQFPVWITQLNGNLHVFIQSIDIYHVTH